ncbi:FIST C-terminal domain-containing protein [Candidatus Parcubacteria bacterium]|nr:FIST C-terminal domain-containing protein [Patescibacteria group bacterium]MBU4466853.1 FIST C-terminal domain-containing protein [Patescibacteria group bacterium]MCG2688734.1 FIST C-terminal domain-containing protein [Candidatus Parcubacteria bacterium]
MIAQNDISGVSSVIKTAIGISDVKDPFEAGSSACQQALDKVGGQAELVIVFASVSYDQEKMISGVRSVSKEVPLVGCSDSGEITTNGPTSEQVAVMAINADNIDFVIGVGMGTDKDSHKAGVDAANQVKEKSTKELTLLMTFLDGLAENGAAVVRGLQEVLGKNLPIVGGSAGDDFLFKKTFQYYNDQIMTNAVIAIGFSGDFSFGVGVRHGWEPIGLPMKVTEAIGSRIIKVNDRPALSIYEDYFGKRAEELIREPIARMAYTYPLGMSVKGSEELLIRDVVIANKEGEITCAAEIEQGAEIRLMLGEEERAIVAAQDAAKQALSQLNGVDPKAIFVFNCMARRKLLGANIKKEIDAIQDVLGKEVAMIGFYTYGEVAPLAGELGPNCFSVFHNETMTLMVLGE